MAGFDAATAVEPMDWNFEKFGGGSGVVPEPSTKDMKKFQGEFGKIMREGAALEVPDEDAAKLSDEEFETLRKKADDLGDRLDQAIAKLCKDQPSVEQVSKLPFRVKTAFSRWLLEQFRPEGETAGTKK